MALPVFKLAYVAAKQIAKPMGKALAWYAHQNVWTRTKVVEPAGQIAHWIAVRSDRIVVGNWRAAVRPLPPEEALQWGSSVMSETFIFSVAAGFIIWEYRDKNAKDAEKKAQLEEWRKEVGERTMALEAKLDSIAASRDVSEAALRAEIERLRAEQEQRWSLPAAATGVTSAVDALWSGTRWVGAHVQETILGVPANGASGSSDERIRSKLAPQ